MASSGGGGGGHVPLRPPPLGSGTGDRKVLFLHFYMDAVCLAIVLAVDLDLDKCSDVRMRENYVTKGIPKTSSRIHHLYVC